jgi:IMP dehydrogenase/GMP reductase
LYDAKEAIVGVKAMRFHERMIMLQFVDAQWKDHLLAMDHLKEGIGLRGYGQRDPLVEYKKESFTLFEDLMSRIEEDTVRLLFLLQPVDEKKAAEEQERRERRQQMIMSQQQSSAASGGSVATQVKREAPKVGRNDPCPCGSGKKYKKCHGGERVSETKITGDALTFDDVLIVPMKSDVLPTEVNTSTRLTNRIELKVPILSAAMDTVTESRLAIALAQQGGIGIIHKNLSIEKQAAEVDKVKRSESGMIVDPITMSPEQKIQDAVDLMAHFKISGVPITENGRLVGILTNRDLRFETRFHLPIRDVMTKDELVTVPVGTTLEEAQRILHKHRIEKLLVVDERRNLKGLITVKDITKKIKYPLSAKDAHGRLRAGAAIGASAEFLERAAELIRMKVDIIAIDTAHGHSSRVLDAVKAMKRQFPDVELIVGNIATEGSGP